MMRTFFRAFWIVGIGALVISAAGAGWTIYARSGGDVSAVAAGGKTLEATSAERVVAALIGYADVKGGQRNLDPVVPGRIVKVGVQEDQTVKAGDVLLSLDPVPAQVKVRQAEAAVEIAEIQLEQARKGIERQRLQEAQLQASIDLVKSKQKAAEEMYAQKQYLLEKKIQGDPQGHELKAAKAGVEAIRSSVKIEEAKLAELRLNDPQDAVRLAEKNRTVRKAELEGAQKELAECELRAPEDGTVLRVLVGAGEVLGPQAKHHAIVFAPNRQRIIRAELDQEYANRVRPGQPARIEDDSRSGDEWKGVVEHVPSAYLQRRSNALDPFTMNETRILECTIVLEPSPNPPRLGQRVRVKVLEPNAH
jgi:HlyD family secretion protein